MSFRPLNSLGPNPRPRRFGRLIVFQGVVIATFLFMAIRIYQIQFLEADAYILQADDNRFDEVCIPATRGIVTDRFGKPLAVNVASANVVVTPAELPSDDTEEMRVLEHLAGLIGMPLSGELNTRDERGIPQHSLVYLVDEGERIAPYRGVIVKRDIDYNVARIIEAEKLPGVAIDWVSARHYPTGSLTAHLVGYMGPIQEWQAEEYEERCYVLDRDRIGYDGIEFSLESYLAGRPGRQLVERDVAGLIVDKFGEVPPEPGYSIQLTIDTELQALAQQHLIEAMDKLRTTSSDANRVIGYDRGVVIAMNPQTGEILSLVSWPTYDNERFARGIDYPYYLQVYEDPLRPLFNQAISSLYPPGSIFKIITATAVLEEGVVPWDYQIEDPGAIQLVNRYYPNDPGKSQEFVCWSNKYGYGHERVNMIQALAWSCDVYFYKVGGGYTNPENQYEEVPGLGLNIERLGEWMEIFGLGDYTGIELAGEINGIIPDPAWKRRTWGEQWSTGDTYNSAFGQGYVLVTPLQMINALNMIANDGLGTRPTLIREIYDENGNLVQGFEPDTFDMRDRIREYWEEAYGEAYPDTLEQSLDIVQEGMYQATHLNIDEEDTRVQGTAIRHQQNLPYVDVSGKTGTAEFCDNIANALERCIPGAWPAHAWYMGYAPSGNPEISIIAFVYNGNEGSTVALPIVSALMDDYFRLKTERAVAAEAESAPTTTPTLPTTISPTPTVPAP